VTAYGRSTAAGSGTPTDPSIPASTTIEPFSNRPDSDREPRVAPAGSGRPVDTTGGRAGARAGGPAGDRDGG
jgi:hypothetical protein